MRILLLTLLTLLIALPGAASADPPDELAQALPTPPVITAAQLEARISPPRAKLLVVNVWASWCEPCREEWPLLGEFVERYRAHGLELIAISMDAPEDSAQLAEFLDTHATPFPVFWWQGTRSALESVLADAWISGLPTTLVMDAKGEVILTIDGMIEKNRMDHLLKTLLLDDNETP